MCDYDVARKRCSRSPFAQGAVRDKAASLAKQTWFKVANLELDSRIGLKTDSSSLLQVKLWSLLTLD